MPNIHYTQNGGYTYKPQVPSLAPEPRRKINTNVRSTEAPLKPWQWAVTNCVDNYPLHTPKIHDTTKRGLRMNISRRFLALLPSHAEKKNKNARSTKKAPSEPAQQQTTINRKYNHSEIATR